MNEPVYAGSVISELVALIERRVCCAPDCGHLGQPCAGCSVYVCAAHGDECSECGGVHCAECGTFHPVYCKASAGETAGAGEDPVHDYRRAASRSQCQPLQQRFPNNNRKAVDLRKKQSDKEGGSDSRNRQGLSVLPAVQGS
jgi:hypothetical protein